MSISVLTLSSISKIVLASNNQGKLKELQRLCEPHHWQVLAQSEFNIPDIEETGLSFVENAILKARHAAKHSRLPALADDSGLEVLALNGEPGIYSARYAGEHGNDALNNQKLLNALKNIPDEDRKANFRCCLALVRHENDPCPIIAEGVWQGSIARDLKGVHGFGYDPLFIVAGSDLRSAELSPENKNKISHRALAFKKLFENIQQLNG